MTYHICNFTHHIFTTTMFMITKRGKVVVTYDERLLPPIKSHEPLVMWSYEINGQTKTIISLLPQCLWSPNLLW